MDFPLVLTSDMDVDQQYNKILREQTTTGIVSAEEQQEQEQQGQGHGQGDVLLPVPFAV
jgi:hypothetical protein